MEVMVREKGREAKWERRTDGKRKRRRRKKSGDNEQLEASVLHLLANDKAWKNFKDFNG